MVEFNGYEDAVCQCCFRYVGDFDINLYIFNSDFGILVCDVCWNLLFDVNF